jgi:hypothetical protein
LFSRLFGTGPAATSDPNANHEFLGRLASLCGALINYQEGYRYGGQPGVQQNVGVQDAANGLLGVLSTRQFGATVMSAQRIHSEIAAAIDLLNARGICAMFGVTNMWQVLHKIVDGNLDVARFVDRAQSGIVILQWVADNIARIISPTGTLDPNTETRLFSSAAIWLRASGFGVQAA